MLANEKWVNTVLIKWWFDGIESITNQELLELEEMAYACPFVKGSQFIKPVPCIKVFTPKPSLILDHLFERGVGKKL
ncbi:MAG: hypothetical protein HWD58_18220 [Bacteroidota bacterium]|nr:MAG: hypothetical protein HWD58_18220 [Bacteroidota bacterium]